ncbi:MAG: type IV pilus twitching motility protein PilT [Deltaproteobacteria bacterium]|nr:type IV pilus twitching motility protein PilT [Deltaproteobacteria bacterium]
MNTKLNYTLAQLLKALADQKGSDLHLSALSPPRMRIQGDLLPLELPPLTPQNTQDLCYSILSEEQRKRFEQQRELDFAFNVTGVSRFRANLFWQRGTVGGAFRVIPSKIPSIEELGLPATLREVSKKPRGLVLVTGPTGSGKSTTLASMVDFINTNYTHHIITIEDPIEFIHSNKRSLINQREVGSDTNSFARALKSSLREDPDVILVGELRDVETISMALTAAETGHLVLATVHTNSCISTINRIIDVFPSHQQTQVRTQLALSLMGIASQLLIKTLDQKRTVCLESLFPNSAIRNLIREDKVHQIYSAMQIGQEGSGMQTMNQALLHLILKKKVAVVTAYQLSPDPVEFQDMLNKANIKVAST